MSPPDRRASRQARRRAAQRRRRIDLSGVPGARRALVISADGRDRVTFSGCVLGTPPPGEAPDHVWMTTAKGSRTLIGPKDALMVDQLVGFHEPAELVAKLVAQGHDRDRVRRLVRSAWFVTIPGTISPIQFLDTFNGFTLTRGPSQVAKPSASHPSILLRSKRSIRPVAVPGWLYSHMIGPNLRPDLVQTVSWQIQEPSVIVGRIATAVDVLPHLLADGIASLTRATTSASARLVDAQAYGSAVQRLERLRGDNLDWLLSLVSKR